MRFVALAAALLAVSWSCRGTPDERHSPYQLVLAATDLHGKRVGPPSSEHKATVVVFFASWCGPCRKELRVLGEMRSSDPALRIIGMNAHEEWGDKSDEQRLRAFLKEHAPWLQVVRADNVIMKSFGGVPKIPSIFVFDRDGTMKASFRRDKGEIPSDQQLLAAVAAAKSA